MMGDNTDIIVLRDANGHYVTFKTGHLAAQLAENGARLFGVTFPVIVELVHEAQRRGAPHHMTVEDVKKVFAR